MEKPINTRFHALDGCRGLSALCIVIFHCNVLHHLFFMHFFRNSYLLVDFFFVLSGFVITHSYGYKLTSGTALKTYLIRRAARIVPLHLFMLALFVLLQLALLAMSKFMSFSSMQPFTGDTSLPSLATNILLLHSFGIHDVLTWNKPSWSISAEFYTYGVFGVAALVLGPRGLLAFSFIVIPASIAILALYSPDAMDATYDYGFIRCLAGFFAGHLVYRVARKYPAENVLNPMALGGLQCCILALAVTFITVTDKSQLGLAAPLLFSVLVYLLAASRGWPVRLLSGRVITWLGDRSYSLYMAHYLFYVVMALGFIFLDKTGGFGLQVPHPFDEGRVTFSMFNSVWLGDAVMLLFVGAVLLASDFTYRYIELPGKRWMTALMEKRRERAAGTI